MDNLIDNVRTFFTEQYKGVKKSSSFLSFEPLGCIVDPEDFRDDSEQIAEIKAIEQLSILGDRLPEIENIFYYSTNRLSSVYEELIESANYTNKNLSTEDDTPYRAKVGEVKSEALFKFREGQKASIETPEGRYLPVYALPRNWYDPNGFFWVHKTFSAKDKGEKPEDGNKKVGLNKPIPLLWKTNLQVNPGTLKNLSEDPALKKKIDLSAMMNVRLQEFNRNPEKAKPEPKVERPFLFRNFNLKTVNTPVQPAFVEKPAVAQPAIAKPAVAPSAVAQPLAYPAVAKPQVQFDGLRVHQKLNVADRIKINNLLVNAGTSEVAPVRSNEFSMEFDYAIVYLDRPWFSTSLFHYSKLWYCLSLEEGYFSNGEKEFSNPGVLKSIPTAMILIKDLKIEAAWTNEDKQNARNSYGLGIFNTNNLDFNNDEMRIPGVQIIGWICEVLPKLPAMSDPHLV